MLLVSYTFELEVDIGCGLLGILAGMSSWTMMRMWPWWVDVEIERKNCLHNLVT